MSATQTPSLPAKGDTSQEQRLLAGLQDIIRALLRSGQFLVRQEVADLITAKSGDSLARSLKWSELNRATALFNLNISLPRITPKTVGLPLYVAKMAGTTTATISPTGYAIDGRTKPLVNNAASFAAIAARLYVFMHDGTNWFVDGV